MGHLAIAHSLRAGQQLRIGPGFATVLADFDFETYSEAGFIWNEELQKWGKPVGAPDQKKGLGIVGMRAYIEHPTCEVLSLAYDLKDGLGKRHWWPGNPPPLDLLDHVRRGELLEAWNVGFEFLVWNIICVRQFGWPPLSELQVRDAMAKARAFAMPGALDNAGEVLQIEHQKDPEGKRLLDKFSIPCNPTKKRPRRRRFLYEEPEEATKLAVYNIRDITAEFECSIKCPDLPPDELKYWLIDQRVNRRGVAIDTVALDNCISIYEQACIKYGAELGAITGGIEFSEGEQLKGWLRAQGCHLDNMQWETIDAKLKEFDAQQLPKTDPVYRVLKIRATLGSASVKKLYAAKNSLCNGRLYDLFMFFAARTGRWTAVGVQPQNLYKGSWIKSPADQIKALGVIASRSLDHVESVYGDAVEIVACAIRALFIAGPGCDLISSDFSAIEGVVGACLAREQWLIEVFRTHGKLYEGFASRLSGASLEEILSHKERTKSPESPNGNHHPLRNGLGKLAALSGQFGAWIGGWNRFGAREILGSDEATKEAILTYRRSVPNIVEMWGGQTRGDRYSRREELYGLEGAIISAIKNPGRAFQYRDIVYQMDHTDDVLYCFVPSGGYITYHRPRLAPSHRFDWTPAWEVSISYEGYNNNPQMGPIGWIRMDLYGGKAFENVVQRVARDFQCNAMVNVEAGGYGVVLHGHDELVAEVPAGYGSVEDFEERANNLPTWAVLDDGTPWPVKMSGGWRGPRYGKFD